MKQENSKISSKDGNSNKSKALHKEKYLCVPKDSLKNLLYSKTTSILANKMLGDIASFLLKGYSTQEVFSKNVILEHTRGSIYISNLVNPMKIFWLAFMPEKILGKRGFQENKGQIKDLIQCCAELENLQHFVEQYSLYGIDQASPESSIESFLESLLILLTHNFHSIPPCVLHLTHPPGYFSDAMSNLYFQMDKENKRGFLPLLLLPLKKDSFGESQKASLEKVCELALSTHKVGFQMVGRDLLPSHRWALGSIGLNLVRSAYKAGPGNLGVFWQEIRENFAFAVRAHLDQRRFISNLLKNGYLNFFSENPLQSIYQENNAAFFVEIYGLSESALFLSKESIIEEEGWEVAIQTLAYLKELARVSSEKHGISIVLGDLDKEEKISHRFLKLDKKHFPSHCENFSEYTKGPKISPGLNLSHKEKIQKEGELHRYIPSSVSLMPDLKTEELVSLLRYASEESNVYGINIV
ncbi:MAG: hypothetical protein HUU50_22830 [Candidatus Brocadiae bacterium]|nr:hypothetical protein [Candidatus Brocadiia bacterium]